MGRLGLDYRRSLCQRVRKQPRNVHRRYVFEDVQDKKPRLTCQVESSWVQVVVSPRSAPRLCCKRSPTRASERSWVQSTTRSTSVAAPSRHGFAVSGDTRLILFDRPDVGRWGSVDARRLELASPRHLSSCRTDFSHQYHGDCPRVTQGQSGQIELRSPKLTRSSG